MRVKEESEKAGLEGGKVEAVTDFIFLGSEITVDGDRSMKLKMPAPWKGSYDKPSQRIKKQRHHFVNKGSYSQSYGFSNSHAWMRESGHKKDSVPMN